MKRLTVVTMVLLLIVAATGVALAAGTANVAVTAAVAGSCRFYQDGAMNFTLDPALGGNVNAVQTQAPIFGCTKGTLYTVTADNGLNFSGSRRMAWAGAPVEYIPYSFTFLPASGTGAGHGAVDRVSMTIGGTVLAADYASSSVGAYADTVVLTINP